MRERELGLPKLSAPRIFQAVSVFCLVTFMVSFYGPISLFSRPLLLGALAIGVTTALISLCSGIFWQRNKTSVAIGIGVLVGFMLAAGVPVLLLFVYGLPPQD